MDNDVKAFLLLLIIASMVPSMVYNYLRSSELSNQYFDKASEIGRNTIVQKNEKVYELDGSDNEMEFQSLEFTTAELTEMETVIRNTQQNKINFRSQNSAHIMRRKAIKMEKSKIKNDEPKNYPMRKRAAEVMERCSQQKGHLPPVRQRSNQFLVTLRGYHYAYYPIAKCGWTTWTHIMFNAVGKSKEVQRKSFRFGWFSPFQRAGMRRAVIPFHQLKKFRERLLFVRNPYERLVSAYKNKFLHGNYPSPCRQRKDRRAPHTFPLFIKCILESARYPAINLSTQRVAKMLDIHWTPQYWSSLPCQSNFTLIGHFGSLTEDMRDAVEILQLNTNVPHENASQNSTHPLRYWFNLLPRKHKLALQQLYKYDFMIFGFDDTVPS